MTSDISAVFEKRLQEKSIKAQKVNNQLKEVISELTADLSDIQNSFDDCEANSMLVCQAPLNNFHEEEDRFNERVTQFTQTLFAESQPNFRPNSEEAACLLRGQAALQEHEVIMLESARLGDATRLGIEGEVAAKVALARTRAKTRALQRLCADPGVVTPILTETEHRANLTRLHSLRSHVERLRRVELPGLIDQICDGLPARLETVRLKIEAVRHSFFLHRQEKLLALLLKQEQWHSLVIMMQETERRTHKMLLRTLQRLEEERNTLLSKTVKTEFDPLDDFGAPNLDHPDIQTVLKTLGYDRLKAPDSEISAQNVAVDSQRNEDYLAQLQELEDSINALASLIHPNGPGTEYQLSYPEVRQLLSSTKAQVKVYSQKVQHFSKMAALEKDD